MSDEVTDRDLDDVVAERVMGITLTRAPLIPRTVSSSSVFTDDGVKAWRQAYPNSVAVNVLPHYSTRIADAMEVVEMLRTKQRHVFINSYDNGMWRVWFGSRRAVRDNDVYHCESLPRAICLAALAIVDGDEL